MDCYYVPKCTKFLCKEIYDRKLERKLEKFVPVNTGFSGVDYVLLISQSVQENTVIPFHFIPTEQLNHINGNKKMEEIEEIIELKDLIIPLHY